MAINTIFGSPKLFNDLIELSESTIGENIIINGVIGGNYVTASSKNKDPEGRVLSITPQFTQSALNTLAIQGVPDVSKPYLLVNSGDYKSGYDIVSVEDVFKLNVIPDKYFTLPSVLSYEAHDLYNIQVGTTLLITDDTISQLNFQDGAYRLLLQYTIDNTVYPPDNYFVLFRNLTTSKISVEWNIPQQQPFFNRLGYIEPMEVSGVGAYQSNRITDAYIVKYRGENTMRFL